MSTLLKKHNTAESVSYCDGDNIVKDGSENYYMIAQVDSGMAVLFELRNKMKWNRKCKPRPVNWTTLNTAVLQEIFNLKFPVTKVRSKITIEIL